MRLMLMIVVVVMFSMMVQPIAQCRTPARPCTPGNLKDSGPETDAAIEGFWQDFQASLRSNDKGRIAKMVDYPVEVFSGNKFEIHNEQEFVRYFNKIFPKNLREMLLRQQVDCIHRVGSKGFSVAHGQLWFDEYSDGKVKIFGVTAVVYPGE